MAGDRELGDDGDSFQVHGECPEQLHPHKLMVDEEGKDCCTKEEDLYPDHLLDVPDPVGSIYFSLKKFTLYKGSLITIQ